MEQWTPEISWSSDRSLRVVLGDRDDDATHTRVVAVWRALSAAAIPGVIDVTAAYAAVQVAAGAATRDKAAIYEIERWVRQVVHTALDSTAGPPASSAGRLIEIPVCYGGEHGPDLAETAALRGMSPERLIELHTSATYSVRFLGFSPGFAYLAGLPEAIHTPRLATPRRCIAAGSVGIAGSQTGIYPLATPGGWRIIGRTPLRMFDPGRGGDLASLLLPGDRVRFVVCTSDDVAWASSPSLNVVSSTHIQPRGEAPRLGQDAQATAELGQGAQATTCLHILHPGHFTTIQDLGRIGHTALGLPRSGAADHLSLRFGNRLVGNPDSAAALEMTLFGCTIECDQSITLALTGSDAAATITRQDGSIVEVARSQAFTLNPGERLKVADMRTSARAYLCVAGGIEVPVVLGSRSTHAASGIGGLNGRTLRAGDQLPIGRPVGAPTTSAAVRTTAEFIAHELRCDVLTLTLGPHAALVSDIAARLDQARLTVTNNADRSGVRLCSDVALGTPPGNLLTEPMLPGGGSVQLTPSGELIILGPDGPTTGGYAVVASIAQVGMAALGQLKPGDEVRCEVVSETEARSRSESQITRLDELLPPIAESDPHHRHIPTP